MTKQSLTPTTWVTICDTCRLDREAAPDGGETDGARLAALVERAAETQPAGDDGIPPVRVRRHSCLMGCVRACNVTVQAHGKLCYTLAGFAPEAEAAEALLDWARRHAESATGQVPYKTWPQPVKGRFVTRHPPLPEP